MDLVIVAFWALVFAVLVLAIFFSLRKTLREKSSRGGRSSADGGESQGE